MDTAGYDRNDVDEKGKLKTKKEAQRWPEKAQQTCARVSVVALPKTNHFDGCATKDANFRTGSI